MNLITAVGRILRANGVIRGDTDLPTTLSDLQHGATINLAAVAIQDDLNDLVSDELIPYEYDNTGSIVTVAGTRTYSLPSNFVQFFGSPAVLYRSSNNVNLYEYPGGLERLIVVHQDYATTQSDPQYWYLEPGTTKKIGFWPVPSSAITFTFPYEKDVSVTSASDTLPFQNEIEAQTFCRIASRRFKFLYESLELSGLDQDPERTDAKATLFALIKGRRPSKTWAPIYR
jgi:hypothetical protein